MTLRDMMLISILKKLEFTEGAERHYPHLYLMQVLGGNHRRLGTLYWLMTHSKNLSYIELGSREVIAIEYFEWWGQVVVSPNRPQEIVESTIASILRNGTIV